MDAVRPIIRLHHERLDGSGYPDGLMLVERGYDRGGHESGLEDT